MAFLARFFGGMTLSGYVITFLLTACLGLSITTAWLNHSKDKAQQELAASEQAIMQLVETASSNRATINELIYQNEACAKARENAEWSALEAARELHRLSVEREKVVNERAEAIEDDIDSSVPRCDCTVPARTARLLIDAACSANRDANCP